MTRPSQAMVISQGQADREKHNEDRESLGRAVIRRNVGFNHALRVYLRNSRGACFKVLTFAAEGSVGFVRGVLF